MTVFLLTHDALVPFWAVRYPNLPNCKCTDLFLSDDAGGTDVGSLLRLTEGEADRLAAAFPGPPDEGHGPAEAVRVECRRSFRVFPKAAGGAS